MWTAAEQDVTGADAQELKWTAVELLARATSAQRKVDEVFEAAALPELPPEERKVAYDKALATVKALQSDMGVRGLPCFSRLSYFRCCTTQSQLICLIATKRTQRKVARKCPGIRAWQGNRRFL